MNLNEIFQNCVHSFTDPHGATKKIMKADVTDAILAVLLGSLIPAVIAMFVVIIAASAVMSFSGLFMGMDQNMVGYMATFLLTAGPAIAASMLIIIPLVAVICWLVCSFIIWIVAKTLGGTGDYLKFATAWAFPLAVSFALAWIPIVNVLVALYMLYILYILLQPAMKMTPDQAVLTIIGTAFLGIVLWALFGGIGAMRGAMWRPR